MRKPKPDVEFLNSGTVFLVVPLTPAAQTWFELECGDSNQYASWCITRGRKVRDATGNKQFEHDDNGQPFEERHVHIHDKVFYTRIHDREAGARKRLAKIMERYPALTAYVQTDPRGAALYILRPGDVPAGEKAECYYSRGIVVCR